MCVLTLPEAESIGPAPISPECPVCGAGLSVGKTERLNIVDDPYGRSYVVLRRRWYCGCGYRTTSKEWRPLGANACCESELSRVSGGQGRYVQVEGRRAWERERHVLCDCGRLYTWLERALL